MPPRGRTTTPLPRASRRKRQCESSSSSEPPKAAMRTPPPRASRRRRQFESSSFFPLLLVYFVVVGAVGGVGGCPAACCGAAIQASVEAVGGQGSYCPSRSPAALPSDTVPGSVARPSTNPQKRHRPRPSPDGRLRIRPCAREHPENHLRPNVGNPDIGLNRSAVGERRRHRCMKSGD